MTETELLTGEQIFLRPMTGEDTPLIVRWRNKERVYSHFIYREPFTEEGHENWRRTMVETGRAAQFILCEKETGRPVGSVYFRDIRMVDGCDGNRAEKEAEYGIFIGEDDAVGKGYGTQAAALAVRYGFTRLCLDRIFLRVFTDNTAAVRSYEKAGFVKEKVLKDVECSDAERKDMYRMSLKKERISFVIPCYRSELTLTGVVKEIEDAMEAFREEGKAYCHEIILVNDCSPDHTFDVIAGLCKENAHIKGINLAKNFGQHAALMAGFRYVQGDVVVCLDDDGQTPADEVGKLLDTIHEGADVVYAKYDHKMHSLFRNMGSRLNEEMAKVMLGKPKELYVSSYFAARRFVVEEMKRYTNAYPYVIGLVLRATDNIRNVTVHHREREVGTSGYTLKKLLGLWMNGFTAFSVKPLRIATAIGGCCAAAGVIYGIYTVIKKLINPAVPVGFSSLMSAIVFLGGMTMAMLGLVGEYIGRMYISMNNSPQYVIKETLNEGGETPDQREETPDRGEKASDRGEKASDRGEEPSNRREESSNQGEETQ